MGTSCLMSSAFISLWGSSSSRRTGHDPRQGGGLRPLAAAARRARQRTKKAEQVLGAVDVAHVDARVLGDEAVVLRALGVVQEAGAEEAVEVVADAGGYHLESRHRGQGSGGRLRSGGQAPRRGCGQRTCNALSVPCVRLVSTNSVRMVRTVGLHGSCATRLRSLAIWGAREDG